jgi:hypothetical protein
MDRGNGKPRKEKTEAVGHRSAFGDELGKLRQDDLLLTIRMG